MAEDIAKEFVKRSSGWPQEKERWPPIASRHPDRQTDKARGNRLQFRRELVVKISKQQQTQHLIIF